MNRAAVIAGILILVLGATASPRRPPSSRVDPSELLAGVIQRYEEDGTRRTTDTLDSFDTARMIASNYTPLVEGEEQVMGRDTWIVRMRPMFKSRPWRQIWVDKQSLEILAIRDWGHRNTIRRSLRLENGRPRFAVRWDEPKSVGQEWLPGVVPDNVALPSHIPTGFRLARVGQWRDRPGECQVVYSDGLFNISLFYGPLVSKASTTQESPRVFDCGSALACSFRSADRSVTIVADLPRNELLRIAWSIN